MGFDMILGNFKSLNAGILNLDGTRDWSAGLSGYKVHSSFMTGTVVFSMN